MAGYIVAAVAEMVGAAAVQEVVNRTVSVVLGKRKEKASRGQYMERLRKAVHEVEFVLERTAKMPITEVSLLRDRIELKRDFIEAAALVVSSRSKKRQSPQGQPEISQSVVNHSSSLHPWSPAMLSVSSFIGKGMTKDDEQCLSCDVIERFEKFADSARNILIRVESGCSHRRYTPFPYPFVRQLLEGKTLRYSRIQGRQLLTFQISPFISEGRGVEAELWCSCFDPERLDKYFFLNLMLQISESTDIVRAAIDSLRSSALQNLVAPDAIIRELAQLPNLQDKISSSCCYDSVGVSSYYAFFSSWSRPDPLCCQANGHVQSTMSSEISQNFQEQIIYFDFRCHVPALEYSLPSASDEAGRNVMADGPPLELSASFAPHDYCWFDDVTEVMGGKREERPFGDIQQTVDMVRSRSVECLINQPETTRYRVDWSSRHGSARFEVEKSSTYVPAVPKARGRYNTRSGGKGPVEARGRYNTRSGRAKLSTS